MCPLDSTKTPLFFSPHGILQLSDSLAYDLLIQYPKHQRMKNVPIIES